MSVRTFTMAALVGLSAWLVLEALAIVGLAIVTPMIYVGFAVPLFGALHIHAYARFAHATLTAPAWTPAVWGAGTVLVAVGMTVNQALTAVGTVLWAAAGIVYSIKGMKAVPKESLLTDDPLTKGDDACFKHAKFSHRFLPIGLLMLAIAASTTFISPEWGHRLNLAGVHITLIGYALLSTYGIAHLWVPRFSGVPAIAAGAIKGELHTTLLGLTGLTIGFLTGIVGIMAGLGFFVFVGFFTFMGVLGANMMRNKSKTQSVTPEFVYIPWTFTAIFWLISAVLMGLFLNVVPDVFADKYLDLRDMHVGAAMVGGFLQMAVGLLTRILPAEVGNAPPRFQGNLRGAYFAFNVGLIMWLYGGFVGGSVGPIGLGLVAVGLFLMAPLAKLMAPPQVSIA